MPAKFSRGFFWSHLGKITVWLLTFLTSVLITRQLGPKNYGLWAVSFSLGATLLLIFSFGLERTISVYLPRLNLLPGRAAALVKAALTLRIATVVLIALLAWFFSREPTRLLDLLPNKRIFLFLGSLAVLLGGVTALWKQIFNAQIKTRLTTMMDVGAKLAFLLGVVLIIGLHQGLTALYVCALVVPLFTIVVYFRLGRSWFRQPSMGLAWRPLISFSFFSWLILFANYFLGKNLDVLMITRMVGDLRQTGYYNLSFTLISTLGLALGAGFIDIAIPMLSEIKSKQGVGGLAQAWVINLKAIVLLCFTGIFFLAFNTGLIIRVVYSAKYEGAINPATVYAGFFCIIYLLGGGLPTSMLYVINLQKKILQLRLVMGAANILLNLLLIPYYGAMGAVVATGISSVGITLWEIVLIRGRLKITYPWGAIGKVVASSLVAIGCSALISPHGAVQLLLRGLIYLVIFTAISYFLKPLDRQDEKLLQRAHPWLGWLGRKFSR